MIFSTYHAHTSFCDGSSTAEEMIRAAVACGCPEIGFSGHSYIQGEDWCMTEEGSVEYIKTLHELREKYKNQIKVYIGIEHDTESVISRESYDYVIGSVHSVLHNGKSEAIDLSFDNFARIVEESYGGDVYALCEDYFEAVSKVYDVTKCDIIGHFDLVTKFIDLMPFDTAHPRYVAAWNRALDILLKTPAVFEVNTGAMSRGYRKEPYPATDILERIIAAGKPIVVNSDSHSASTVDFGLCEIADRLIQKGAVVLTSMEDILKITRGKNN